MRPFVIRFYARSEVFMALMAHALRLVGVFIITCRDAFYGIAAFARADFWLRVAPPVKSARIRAKSLVAQCRHRLSFAGGLFIVASPA